MCPASRPGPPVSSRPAPKPTTGQQESQHSGQQQRMTAAGGEGGRPSRQWSHSGSWTSISAPSPLGPLTSNDPPRAATRSRRPIRPEPRAGSTPPVVADREMEAVVSLLDRDPMRRVPGRVGQRLRADVVRRHLPAPAAARPRPRRADRGHVELDRGHVELDRDRSPSRRYGSPPGMARPVRETVAVSPVRRISPPSVPRLARGARRAFVGAYDGGILLDLPALPGQLINVRAERRLGADQAAGLISHRGEHLGRRAPPATSVATWRSETCSSASCVVVSGLDGTRPAPASAAWPASAPVSGAFINLTVAPALRAASVRAARGGLRLIQ